MTVEPAPPPQLARLIDITGPRSFVGGWRRFIYLSLLMAKTEWKLRFFDSLLGYLWTLVRPLLFFGVLYVVFSAIIDIDAGVPHYPALLLSGMVLYLFFVEVTTRALTSVVDSENLVRKVHFPLMAIPASAILIALFGLALNMVVLAVGTSAGLAALYVRARDMSPIWEVSTQALFYLTPIIYPIQLVVARAGDSVAHLRDGQPTRRDRPAGQARDRRVEPAQRRRGDRRRHTPADPDRHHARDRRDRPLALRAPRVRHGRGTLVLCWS